MMFTSLFSASIQGFFEVFVQFTGYRQAHLDYFHAFALNCSNYF